MGGHPWIAPNKGRLGSYAGYLRYAPERRARCGCTGWPRSRGRLLPGGPVAAPRPAPGRRARPGHRRRLHRHPGRRRRRSRRLPLRSRCTTGSGSTWSCPCSRPAWPPATWSCSARGPTSTAPAVDPHPDQPHHPRRHHLKLPMSILNTLVWRGLPADRTLAAPRVTEFLTGIVAADPFLGADRRLVLLGEVASLAAPPRLRDPARRALPVPSCSAASGASLHGKLEDGERAMTMAALLHRDRRGTPVAAAMVERSGMATTAWLEALFEAVLPPLLRPVPLRHGLLAPRRERHPGPPRRRPHPPGRQGLRRRRQRVRPDPARAGRGHHPRGRRGAAGRAARVAVPVPLGGAVRRPPPLPGRPGRGAPGGGRAALLDDGPVRRAQLPGPLPRAGRPLQDLRPAGAPVRQDLP